MNRTISTFLLFLLAMINIGVGWAQEQPEASQAANQTQTQVTLPSEPARYVDFYSSEHLNFAIDVNSITIQPGPENEVRYAIRATGKQGAVNVNYEGIRCDHRQKIIYAVELQGGGWTRVRSPEWNPIYARGINLQHNTLAHHYFCQGPVVSGSLETIRDRFVYKRPLPY